MTNSRMPVAEFVTKPNSSRSYTPLACCCFVVSCILSSQVTAQGDFFRSIDVSQTEKREESSYSLFGWVTQKISYGLENPSTLFSRQDKSLNKIETSLFAQLDSSLTSNIKLRLSAKAYRDDIYRFDDDKPFSRDEVSEFRSRFEVKDFYLEQQFDNGIYFKAGNQILAWGLAEYLRVTDVINTEDQYTFGQQDLEDLRLQVPAMLLSYSAGNWVFDSVITYQAGRNKISPAGDEFDQFVGLRNAGASLFREAVKIDHEVFFRASTHYAQGDFQFVLGEYNENSLSGSGMNLSSSASPEFRYSQNRMRLAGLAANWVNGSWLVFAEFGKHFGKAVQPHTGSLFAQLNAWDEKDQVLGVLGLEYNGFRNLTLTFELDGQHTEDHDQFVQGDQDQTGAGLRFYWTALNERLKAIGVWSKLADNAGRVSRLSLEYNWSDNLDLGLLWVDYQSPEESIFYEFRNNDVLQLQLRYSFQL